MAVHMGPSYCILLHLHHFISPLPLQGVAILPSLGCPVHQTPSSPHTFVCILVCPPAEVPFPHNVCLANALQKCCSFSEKFLSLIFRFNSPVLKLYSIVLPNFLLTTLKALTVWITTNCGKLLKRDETTRPPYLLLEKPICRSRSNSQSQTWNNGLVPNWERSSSRLYIVTLLI